MPTPYYRKKPYGWCLDYLYDDTKYEVLGWKKWVEQLTEWLSAEKINYSVVHYKSMVRVHIGFNAIKKMGFTKAVELHTLASKLKEEDREVLMPGRKLEADYDLNVVKRYFQENDLEIDDYMKEYYEMFPSPIVCPFCGSLPVFEYKREIGMYGDDFNVVRCKCANHMYGLYYRTSKEAIENWNRMALEGCW